MKSTAAARRYRLLVAEDDTEMRGVLKRTLTHEGFSVDVAADGNEACRVLELDHGYDLLISDVQMPGKNAEELLPVARLLCPGLKIVVISGHSELDTYLSLMSKGASDFLAKPFKIPDLLEVIYRALGIDPAPG